MGLSNSCLPVLLTGMNWRRGPCRKGGSQSERFDALQCQAGKDRGFLWDDALAGFGGRRVPTGPQASMSHTYSIARTARSRRVTIGEPWQIDARRSPLAKPSNSFRARSRRAQDPIDKSARAARACGTSVEIADDFMRLHSRQPSARAARSRTYEVLAQEASLRPGFLARLEWRTFGASTVARMHSSMG